MAESLVSDWISDYDAVTPAELSSFSAQHLHNDDVAASIFAILEDYDKHLELVNKLCHQLFSFYRSKDSVLVNFTLQFIPSLIYLYLSAVSRGDKASCHSVETLLLGIYNLEIVDESGQPKVVSFRMPFLAQPSIYHEAKGLSQGDLRRWEEASTKIVKWGPMPHIETMNAQNRLRVMATLMFMYNQNVCMVQRSSLLHLCKAATRLVTQGFNQPSSCSSRSSYIEPKLVPRIPMSAQFLLQVVHAIYFAMFNEFASVATQAVEDIHTRSCFELYPEVILVTRAIKHSLSDNPSGQPSDGPMGISVALSPATTTVTMTKSMITNASFRTKKLPDDIPIQATTEDSAEKSLLSITEEGEQDTNADKLDRNSSMRGSKDGNQSSGGKGLPKLPAFPGLSKKVKDLKHMSKNGIDKIEFKKVNKESKSTSRVSLQISTNGDTVDVETSPLPLIRKKSMSVDITPNGPMSLDSNVNGLANMTLELDKVNQPSDSLQTCTDMSDITADSLDSADSQEMPLSVRLINVIDNKMAMQVSQV